MNAAPDIADGLHFGLDENLYHSLPMVSAHDIKQLLISPLDYWENSALNPTPDEESDDDTFARILGRAYHTRILEGREAFVNGYAAKFECPKGALDKNEELKEECRSRGLSVGGNKPDLIDRLIADDPKTQIKALLEQQYLKANEGK